MPLQPITIEGFLSDFESRNSLMPDRPFCWILGAGTSVQSGIATGGELARKWLEQIHVREDAGKLSLARWATADNLGIPGFDFQHLASFYPQIYWRRFHRYREEGYAFLEKAMENVEPSYGYSVLAQIMADTRHKAAVTTNFDNLVADALAIYTRSLPLVCGHESLTGFIRPNLQRPVIAKIHRDLLLNPKSEPEELERLPGEWVAALRTILDHHTPIVIGYGGNDGSLMKFLEDFPAIKGGIFWCYRGPDLPDERIQAVVEHHQGDLVPILGFDELMLQLGQKLKLADPREGLQATHDKRVKEWQRQFEELNKRVNEPAKGPTDEAALVPVRTAAAEAVERFAKEKEWWAWQLKADAEPDSTKKEAIFREGMKDFPDSAELAGNFAVFLQDVRKDYDEAERLYRRALELAPKHANNIGNFAVFLQDVRKDYDEAERLYRRALELAPKHANNIGNFAVFLQNVRKDYDEAERLYRRALELAPKHVINIGNFAIFVQNVRKDYDEAERLYRRALELNLKDADNIGNLAAFMESVRKDYDEAVRLYRRAVQLDPASEHWQKQLNRFLEAHPERNAKPEPAARSTPARRKKR